MQIIDHQAAAAAAELGRQRAMERARPVRLQLEFFRQDRMRARLMGSAALQLAQLANGDHHLPAMKFWLLMVQAGKEQIEGAANVQG